MPIVKKIELNEFTQVFIWEITESFEELFEGLELNVISLARLKAMKSESHQKGFLSVRKLLEHVEYSDFDLYYDALGKPHLKDGKHISISHSHTFSAIAISNELIGIDLEICKEKILKIASRYMAVSHLENLSHEEQIQKATVIWGIKESIFKIKNEIGISFKDNIFEDDFNLLDKKCHAELRFNKKIEHFDIVFDFIDNFVIVCARQNEYVNSN